jgi:hypothetical protein
MVSMAFKSLGLPAAHPNIGRVAEIGVLCLIYGWCAKAVEKEVLEGAGGD